MASFGQNLKREREKKKITLDQVAVSTKISVRMLRAIEEEKFDLLPGGIFNKGFIRAYARHLGLDEEQTVADYVALSNPPSGTQPEDLELRAMAEQKDKERQRQARLTRDFPWGWVASALLIMALGFSIWGVRSGRSTATERSGVPQAAPNTQTESKKVQPEAPLKANVSPDVGSQFPAAAQPATASQAVVKEASVSSSAVPSQKLLPPAPTPERTLAAEKSFTVLVTAKDNSWLSINADGKEIFTGTLIAPGVQLVKARNSIVVRAGNLGGLDIDFNGKRLAQQGESGEAKTLTFDTSGLTSPPSSKQPDPPSLSKQDD